MRIDDRIDAEKARYFCAFKDRELVAKLEQIVQKSKTRGEEALEKTTELEASGKRLDEAAFLLPLLTYASTAVAKEIASIVATLGVAWLGSKVAATGLKKLSSGGQQPADATSQEDAVGKKEDEEIPQVGVEAGSHSSVANSVCQVSAELPAAQKFQQDPVFSQELVDAVERRAEEVSAATTAGAAEEESWTEKVLKMARRSVMSFLSWLAALLAKLGIEVSIATLAGILVGIAAAASWLVPRMALWLRRALRKRGVCEVEVPLDGGSQKMLCWLSLDDCKWHCEWLGARLASSTRVSGEEFQDLLKSSFFQKFRAECQKTLESVLAEPEMVAACASLLELIKKDDKRASELLEKIVEKKDSVLDAVRAAS